MKKFIFILSCAAALAFAVSSCEQNVPEKINQVSIALTDGSAAIAAKDVVISVTSSDNSVSYTANTNESGVASFSLKAGIYQATTSFKKASGGTLSVFNGNTSITVADEGKNEFTLALSESLSSQVIIKELYFGGCPQDADPTKAYRDDAYVVLYNNSSEPADISDYGFAMAFPYNSNGTNKYLVDGVLSYESADWIPAANATWFFNTTVVIPAYSQITIAIFGAIDHTTVHSKSVNLLKAEYAMYDKEVYTNAKYVANETMATDHYLSAYKWGLGNAWPLSINSPDFYIYKPEGVSVKDYVSNVDNIDKSLGAQANWNAKIKKAWVKDAVEIFSAATQSTAGANNKRFPNAIDAGYVVGANNLGYTIYRNVDKEATEALAENAGKLVTGYAGGTADVEFGTSDPSGIDAEASIAKGAHIIFKDTNNSTNDYHQRKVASLKK